MSEQNINLNGGTFVGGLFRDEHVTQCRVFLMVTELSEQKYISFQMHTQYLYDLFIVFDQFVVFVSSKENIDYYQSYPKILI